MLDNWTKPDVHPLLGTKKLCDQIWSDTLGQKCKSKCLKALFRIRQHFKHVCYWANFYCCKQQNIEQIIWSSGHTAKELHGLGNV